MDSCLSVFTAQPLHSIKYILYLLNCAKQRRYSYDKRGVKPKVSVRSFNKVCGVCRIDESIKQ